MPFHFGCASLHSIFPNMEEIEVPTLFLCPISLQLMRDPVTVCTGITYDRENIEKWLFSCKKNTCPVTKQPLSHIDLTPNHTLQRLIQSWCTLNFLTESVEIPKPTIDKSHVENLLLEAKRFPEKQLNCLKRLQSIVLESESNKHLWLLESLGAIDFLASTIMKNSQGGSDSSAMIIDSAIEVLFHLNLSEDQFKNLINNDGIQFIESMFHVLKLGSYKSRGYSTMLLKSAFELDNPNQLNSVKSELFGELVRVLMDQISQKASKAALKLLVELCSFGRNRIKAVEGGAVLVVIELLLEDSERRICELLLVVLDRLCGCAEGRAEFLNHGGGLAIVSKKILMVSHLGTDRGVRILTSICRYSATPRVLQEMLVVGAVSKLCLVLQVQGSFKAKERARETLKLHSKVWRDSPCIPIPFHSLYP